MVSIDANVLREFSKGNWRTLSSGSGPTRVIRAIHLGPLLQSDVVIDVANMAAAIQVNLRTEVPLNGIVELAFECSKITAELSKDDKREEVIKFWDSKSHCVLVVFTRLDGELCISPQVRLSAADEKTDK